MVVKLQMSHINLNQMFSHLSLIEYGKKEVIKKNMLALIDRSENLEGHTILQQNNPIN